ncbi:MAG TPA: type II toxin-antitoxin system death-on-curing family toxin [Hansschlegelia sp.]
MPVWVSLDVVLALHGEQVAEHGGRAGPVDLGALEAALHRPENLLHYGSPDLAALAASYAYGLAKDHAFVDGNKRVSFVVTYVFLELNGYDLSIAGVEAVSLWLGLAGGAVSEAELAVKIRSALVAR